MVKKTLLSLAIAATTAGLAGCNISSVEKYNDNVDTTAVEAGQPGSTPSSVSPIFSAANAQLPLATDFVFASASVSDGTANTDDTKPPVTTAMNKLDGFSTVAPIYIEFNAELDSDSVVAGKTVFLVKLNKLNGEPLLVDTSNPFSSDVIAATAYEARAIDMAGTPAIQILPKEPLDPKTKYLVIVTSGVKGSDGTAAGMSSEFALASGDLELPSSALQKVRDAVQGWQALATGFLAAHPAAANKEGSSILSYTFTTGGGNDVLKAMAAPGTFLTSQITTVDAAEGKITLAKGAAAEEAMNMVATGVAMKLNAANAGNPDWTDLPTDGATVRPVLKGSAALAPYYYTGLITAIASGGLDAAVDKPASREFHTLMADATTPVEVPYTTLLTSLVKPKVEALIVETTTVETPTDLQKIGAAESIISAPVDSEAAELKLNAIALQTAQAINAAAPDSVPEDNGGADARAVFKSEAGAAFAPSYVTALTTAMVTSQVASMTSGGTIYEGGLEIPNYLPEAEAGKSDAALGSWSASDTAAQALGLAGAPRDCADKDCSALDSTKANVTYRFPFASKLGDNVIPVLVTMPAASCDPDGDGPAPAVTKPADGWPVVIYQHGITVDRTAGILVGNALAKSCVAMVAIDHVMHGVSPSNATGLVFNVNTIANGAVPDTATAALSPFALARKGADDAGSDFFANLKERHNNVGKNAAQQNVAMEFKAAGAASNVGGSGDLYINLSDFARTRDAMRQTVVDLMNLNASIDNMDVNADGTADDLDPRKVYFIGHSLGGIVGTTFVAVNNDPSVQTYNSNLPEIKAAILGNPGGGVVKLLENSPAIGASKILPGLKLANAELYQGSPTLEKFFGVMQAMVDSADPINFAYAEHMQNLPIITYTAVNDVVVPNNALNPLQYQLNANKEVEVVMDGGTPVAAPATAKSYLSGTDPLVSALGITTVVNGSTTAGVQAGQRFSVRTDAAKSEHGTFSSADPEATFKEIFGQVGSFLSDSSPFTLNGINVQDTDVLEQVAE